MTDKSPRGELLDEAKRLVTGDRNNSYGPPTADFERAAGILNAMGYRALGDRPLLPHDIAILVMSVKLSRLTWKYDHQDSWTDTAGYAACGWECAVEEVSPEAARQPNAGPSLKDMIQNDVHDPKWERCNVTECCGPDWDED